MKQRLFGWLISLLLSLTAMAQQPSVYDQQKPFGFCTRSSRTADSAYAVTGGGCYCYPVEGVGSSEVITLTSTGSDMKAEIARAVNDYRVIVFDGSKGDFIVSRTIEFSDLCDKTLLGINGARLCTKWYITQEIISTLNEAGVPGMSTSGGTGGILSSGARVGEQAEFNTRQILINMMDDQKETFRKSGIFLFRRCQNLILRNLRFVGPGSIDVGGDDLLTFNGTKNSWVDHCDFADGMDGNFDINSKSDFNTVSWCTFSYTERSYMHQNTNLIGSSDREATGFLNTTWAFNHWGDRCQARMTMARVGKVHMLNNYFTSAGCQVCINARKNSEFLIEGNYFGKGIKKCFSQTDATAVTWADNNYVSETMDYSPSSSGPVVTVPYAYTVADPATVPTEVSTHAGATL